MQLVDLGNAALAVHEWGPDGQTVSRKPLGDEIAAWLAAQAG